MFRPGYKAFKRGVTDALYAQNAIDVYEHLTKKRKKMPPYQAETKKESKKPIKPVVNYSKVPLTKAAVVHRGKPTNHKKGKKVKVSSEFKNKVVKALESKTCSGSWDQISFDLLRVSNFSSNTQYVAGLGEIQANDYSDWAFDPEDILHAVSVLWNNKPDSQNSRGWSDVNNMGISVNPLIAEVSDARLTTNSRFQLNQKVTIKRCYEKYTIKNVTQRTIKMKIWLCAPKKSGRKTPTGNVFQPTGANSTGTVTDPASIGNPGQVWVSELAKQIQSNINVAQADPFVLYNDCRDCPGFNKVYKTDETMVTLEPGQLFDYFIQGPSNWTLDYNTLFEGAFAPPSVPVYSGIQKFMRYPLFAAWVDLATDGTFVGHYPPNVGAGGKLGLCIERQMVYKFEMPESAGMNLNIFTASAVAGNSGVVENNLRRDCYFRKVYGQIGPVVDLQTVNVQNPAMVIDQTV